MTGVSPASAAEAARQTIEQALADPPLQDLAARLASLGAIDALTLPIGGDVRTSLPPAIARIGELKARLAADGALPAEIALERLVLLRSARAALHHVPALPVDDGVRTLFYEEFRVYATPKLKQRPLLVVGTASFQAAGELVSLTRFPAGQYHWDVSGLPRRMVAQVPLRDLPRVLHMVARRMRGFAPAFYPHVNAFRRNPFVWTETESNRSFHRMARALRLQPDVLGLVARAWLHDPDLAAVSPHLGWINRVFVENGGLVVPNGDAADNPDVLANNASRQQAVERGQYRPRYGLVIWPRNAMLDWAARHPELADA